MKSVCIDNFPDYKPFVYIEPCPEVVGLINNGIFDFGSQSKLAKRFDYTQSLVWCWSKGRSFIPLSVIYFLCSKYNKDFISFIEEKRLRGGCGGGSLTFSKKLVNELIVIDGFIRGDGYIKPHPSGFICIYQKDRKTLKYIKDMLINLGVNKKSINLTRVERRGAGLKHLKNRTFYLHHLTICSIPLKFILVELLKNPVGKKPYDLGVPDIILGMGRESILAEVGGVLSSEGNFNYFDRNPAIRLITKSTLPLRIKELLTILGYKPYKINDKRDGFVSIKLSGYHQCLKLFFELLPYIISHKKQKYILKILRDPGWLNAHYPDILNHNPIGSTLFQRAWKKFSTQKNLRDIIYRKYGLKIPRRTLQHWIYSHRTPPLNMILVFCDILKINPMKILPKEFSIILYVHNSMDIKTFKKLRGNVGWLK